MIYINYAVRLIRNAYLYRTGIRKNFSPGKVKVLLMAR